MIVGLDARCGRSVSIGMRTYVEELVARLPRVEPAFDYRVYDRGENLDPLEQIRLPLAMRRDGVGIAHFMTQYVPLLAGGRFCVTIHDLIHLRFPQYFKATIDPYYRFVVRRACRKAARILTDDPRTIADLVELLGADPAKIRVVPLAPRARFFLAATPFAWPRPYLIYAGNHREHKDVATLLRAWSSLPASYEIDCFLTGPDDFNGELQRCSSGTRHARALGDVDDDALAAYYAGALALVHPSLLEGFGLPLVEAMAQGAPVIATTSSVPAPIAAATLTFPPGDAEAARVQIARLYDDQALRTGLVERGRMAVGTLSWDRTARETAAIYEEIAGE